MFQTEEGTTRAEEGLDDSFSMLRTSIDYVHGVFVNCLSSEGVWMQQERRGEVDFTMCGPCEARAKHG